MFTARSILSLAATSTATQCSAALPTIATTIAPMKNSLSPTVSAASEIEPTRISDMHADRDAGDGERDHGAAHGPRLAVDLVLGVEQVLVGAQREDQAGDVASRSGSAPRSARGARRRCRSRRAPAPGRAGPRPRPSRRSPASPARRRRAGASPTARWRRCARTSAFSRPLEAADEHRRAQHEQDVAEDRADHRRLDDLVQALVQREESDDQLGGVAERDVQQAADARARARARAPRWRGPSGQRSG